MAFFYAFSTLICTPTSPCQGKVLIAMDYPLLIDLNEFVGNYYSPELLTSY